MEKIAIEEEISKCSLMPQPFGYSDVKAKAQVIAFYASFILTKQTEKVNQTLGFLI